MNCRIEFPAGDQQRFSPNLDYLARLIVALAPENVPGQIIITAKTAGVKIEFAGSGDWRGQDFESPLIPRWMFCDAAFQDLVAIRVRNFIDCIEAALPAQERHLDTSRWDLHAEWYR
jgi:hypothetical protein